MKNTTMRVVQVKHFLEYIKVFMRGAGTHKLGHNASLQSKNRFLSLGTNFHQDSLVRIPIGHTKNRLIFHSFILST